MSIAVIQTGGKQYLVRAGDIVDVERVAGDADTTFDLTDLLHGKTVTAKVLSHDRADKIRVIKFKSKVRYLRRHGHRQLTSQIRIESIA